MAVCEPGRILTRNRTLILNFLPPELRNELLLFKGTANPMCGILLHSRNRLRQVAMCPYRFAGMYP